MDRKLQYKILVGASALCWAVWLSRNDMVFNNTKVASSMQVIYKGAYWIHFWAMLQKKEEQPQIAWGVVCLDLDHGSFCQQGLVNDG